jgi:hypothetical protein
MGISARERKELEFEIGLKVSKDLEVRRKVGQFAEEVANTAKHIWDETTLAISGPGHPYQTGDFRESIHAERRRDRGRWPHWWVGSEHPHANMLEHGTGVDKPGSHSPWGPNTPTPEFAIFARTAFHYRGTPDD